MASLNRGHVELLLQHPWGNDMVVSCYADTSVKEGFEALWLQPFKTEASRIRRSLAEDHQAGQVFERNLEAIRAELESPEARQARGMAVFSDAGRNFLLTLSSNVPFADRLVVGVEPYVAPLIEAYLQQQGYLVALVDTHRGRLYASGPGGARLLDESEDPDTRTARSVGERWGKQEAASQRHREDHMHRFHQELADRLKRAWNASVYEGIILLGERAVLTEFRGRLPGRLASRVVLEAPHAWTEGRAEIEAVVRGVIDTAQTAREKQVLDGLAERLKQGCAVAAGPQEVINALRNGQVAELIVGSDTGAAASLCTGCRSLFSPERAACPYCAGTCRKANLWQEIVGHALRHGIWVDRVGAASELDRHGGIAALLVRDEPPWAPPRGNVAAAASGGEAVAAEAGSPPNETTPPA